MLVSENLARIREKLRPYSTQIVGVTKGQPLEPIAEAVEAGLEDLGNNYVQEGSVLQKAISVPRWHFIGQIQSRKAKHLLDYSLIHSLDRVEIAKSLNKLAEPPKRTIDVLIEVNIGAEASKSGIAPEKLAEFIDALRQYPRIRCRGLMVLPPPLFPVKKREPFFKKAKKLFEAYDTQGWNTLSMGTSDDYEIAAANGATLVRLGTVLFGPRS